MNADYGHLDYLPNSFLRVQLSFQLTKVTFEWIRLRDIIGDLLRNLKPSVK